MVAADTVRQVRENLARVRAGIAAACQRAGREPHSVTLVAVTKYVELPLIRMLLDAGTADVGESRAQPLAARAAELGSRNDDWLDPADRPVAGATPTSAPRWHMIGHLQRNKVKLVLPHARILHSLDSDRLAQEIETAAARLNVPIDAFIEVNLSGEASKYGAAPAQLEALVAVVRTCPHIRLRGLMTMPPFDPDPERARPVFARLREVLQDLRTRGAVGSECRHLSMGMSHDFAVAIEEGATFVRVGSALFEQLGSDLVHFPP